MNMDRDDKSCRKFKKYFTMLMPVILAIFLVIVLIIFGFVIAGRDGQAPSSVTGDYQNNFFNFSWWGSASSASDTSASAMAVDSSSSSTTATTATTAYPDNPVTIRFRSFSSGPSLSRPEGDSMDPREGDYGAIRIFMDRVASLTGQLSGNRVVRFEGQQWPLQPGCTPYAHVGRKTSTVTSLPCAPRDAYVDAGSNVAPWGMFFNSVPMGPEFHSMMNFIYGPKGAGSMSALRLGQDMLDERNAGFNIFPVVGSPRQSSGFFKLAAHEVGLKVICEQPWVWRYLNPAESIIKIACANLTNNASPATFVAAVGGVSVLGGVQKGGITAFEFASMLDNWNATKGGFFPLDNSYPCTATTNPPYPTCLQNPGHKGLTNIHLGGWHQPYFLALMSVNKDVFNSLDPEQQAAMIEAGKQATIESWAASGSVECDILRQMLEINNDEVQLNLDGTPKDCDPSTPDLVETCSADMHLASWRAEDYEILQWARDVYLERQKTAVAPDVLTRTQYTRILDAYNAYVAKIHFVWKPENGFPNCAVATDNLF